jgi:hypothetical protein
MSYAGLERGRHFFPFKAFYVRNLLPGDRSHIFPLIGILHGDIPESAGHCTTCCGITIRLFIMLIFPSPSHHSAAVVSLNTAIWHALC